MRRGIDNLLLFNTLLQLSLEQNLLDTIRCLIFTTNRCLALREHVYIYYVQPGIGSDGCCHTGQPEKVVPADYSCRICQCEPRKRLKLYLVFQRRNACIYASFDPNGKLSDTVLNWKLKTFKGCLRENPRVPISMLLCVCVYIRVHV